MDKSPTKEKATVRLCQACLLPYKKVFCQICNRETCYSRSLRRINGFSEEKIVCAACLEFIVYLHKLSGDALFGVWQSYFSDIPLKGGSSEKIS